MSFQTISSIDVLLPSTTTGTTAHYCPGYMLACLRRTSASASPRQSLSPSLSCSLSDPYLLSYSLASTFLSLPSDRVMMTMTSVCSAQRRMRLASTIATTTTTNTASTTTLAHPISAHPTQNAHDNRQKRKGGNRPSTNKTNPKPTGKKKNGKQQRQRRKERDGGKQRKGKRERERERTRKNGKEKKIALATIYRPGEKSQTEKNSKPNQTTHRPTDPCPTPMIAVPFPYFSHNDR
ncbi:hypothetical protein BC567DRAFT_86450 [Phyllosticta citribraziliensis]